MRENGKKVKAWCCSTHYNHADKCPQKGISESAIKRAFLDCLNQLIGNYNDIKSVLEMSISSVVLDDPTDKVQEIQERIDLYQAQILELHKKKTKGLIDQNEYAKQGNKLASMIESAKNEINAIESSYSRATLANRRVEEILNTLNSLEPTEEFDDEIFKRLVESVTINDRCKITFKFKVGLERTIETTIK